MKRKIQGLQSNLLLLSCILCIGSFFYSKPATAAIAVGDIAVIGLNTDAAVSTKSFTVVTLASIPSGEVIFFTDIGIVGSTWQTSPATSEGRFSLTTTTSIAAGTVIQFTVTSGTALGEPNVISSPSVGTLSVESGWTSTSAIAAPFSTTGDQIIIYQGSTASPTFIFAFNSSTNSADPIANGWNDGTNPSQTSNNYSQIPPGLTNGVNSVSHAGAGAVDNYVYSGTLSGTKASVLAAICNPANWSGNDTTPYDNSPGGTQFPGSNPIFTIGSGAPTVNSVSVPSNGTYVAGQNLDFTINFSESITVNTAGGTPQLSLTIGATTRQAVYTSGSTSSALLFRYTVQSGDVDTDGITVGTLAANGGTLQNVSATNANLTLNNVGNTTAILVDAVAPTISSVGVPSNGTYIAGQNLDFTINFSENITVNTAGGTPQLSLTIGATTRQAVYTSGSSTSALLFRYTVQTGELDTDGIAVGTLAANGGTLRDAATNNANLTLNSVGSTTAVLVDAVAPTVSSVSVPSNSTYITGQNLDFTINFSENITVNTAGGTPQLSLTIGATTRQAVYTSGSSTSALLFRYTVQTGELDTDGIAVGTLAANGGTLRDAATNNANLTLNGVGVTTSVLVDAVAPTVSSVTVPSNGTYITGQNLDFTINFSENITVNTAGGTPQLSLTIGATTRQAVYTSGSSTSALLFRYTVQTGELDTDGIAVGTLTANGGTLRDAATNNANLTLNGVGVTTSVLVDAVAPTVSSVTVPSNGTYITGQNLDFTINFSENVTVNTAGGTPQLSLTIGATTRQAMYTSGSSTSALMFRYTVQSGELDTDGIAVGTLTANGGTMRDAATNNATLTLNGVGSTTSVFVDAVAPTVSSVSVPSNDTYITGQNLDFTINFDENITVNTAGGTPQLSVTIGATTRQAVYTSGSASSALLFRYTVQDGDLDTDGIAVGTLNSNGGTLRDAATNNANLTLNSVGSTTAVLVDGVAPTVSSVSPLDETTNVALNTNLVINFNENIAVGTGSLLIRRISDNTTVQSIAATDATQVSVSGNTLTINPTADLPLGESVYINVATGFVTDLAGNSYSGIGDNTTWNYTLLSQTEISVDDPSVTEGNSGSATLAFTVSLSQPAPAGGATVDFATSDGTATAGSDYTATSGTLTYAAGESSKTVNVTVSGDNTLEPNETITLTLSNEAGTNVIISDATGTGTITNDDAAAVTITDISGAENNGGITVTATLDNPVQGGFTVQVSTADGTAVTADNDYTAVTNQTLTFAGTAGETQTFTVTPTADTKLEADETLTVSQANLGATSLPVNITDGATITINNDDAAALTINDVSGNEDDGAITVTVTLDNAVQGGFTADVSTSNGTAVAGSDYTAVSGQTLTFAGTAGESETFTITPTVDGNPELNETINVSLSNLAATTLPVNISDGAVVTIIDDDASQISVSDPTVAEGASGTINLTFTVSLDITNPGTVTVDYATSDGTATAGSDYTAASGTLTFNTGETSKTIDVVVSGDNMLEADETVTVTLSNETGSGVVIADATGTGTITNDDAASLTIADVSGAENNGGITVTATLDNPVQGGFTVQVSTADGTAATADNDYTAVTNQTLTFAGTAGETQTFTVTPTADTKLEADETLMVSQANLGATSLPVNITDGATITISNDDAAALTISDVSGNEDDGAITVTVTLDNAVQGGFTADASTSDGTAVAGSDYTAVSGQTLTFAGTAGESETFTITPTVDGNPELNETINVSLSNLAATTLPVNISDGAVVTIIDDDASQISISDPTVAEGASGNVNLTFTISLDITNPGTVTVDYATSDGTATAGSDYTAASGTLTFNTGETSKTIDVVVSGDNMLEADETVTVTLSNETGSGVVIADATGTGTITNDDAAAVTIADISAAENNGGITVTATLDNPVQGGFTVQVSTADGTAVTADNDYTAVTNQTLTFAGTAGETQTFTVTPTADTKLEADETLTISQANLGATSLPVNITDGATITINNDDAAALTINDVSGNEDDGAITVTVTLDNAVSGGFTVDVSTSNGTAVAGSDYTAVTGQTLTFTGTAGESQTFTVTPTVDTNPEQNETINISLSNLTSTVLPVDITDDAVVTIIDDDAAQISLSDASLTEGTSGTVNLVFTVTLDQAGAATITVDYTTSNGTATAGSDYAAATGTVTFAAGETSKTINVVVAGDDIVEADETLTVTLSNVTGLANILDGTGTGIINNDDAAAVTIADANGAEDGGAITLTATLNHGVQGGFTVNVSTADGTATTADSDYAAISNQTLTFTGTSGETQTFTISPVADNKIEPNETLTISQSNLSGTSFTVDISDGATITITNDDVVSVTLADVSGLETDGTIRVTATLDNAIEGGFSVDVSTANGSATAGSDYTAVSNQTLAFAGTSGETQTFTIDLIDDASIEGDETVTVSMSNLTGTTFPVDISDGATITIIDDEVGLGDNLPQGISPNNDGINDAWIIEGIESYPNNKVAIFNRWGQKIYEVAGYDNTSRLFRGVSNQSVVGDKNLPDGSYFYVVDLGDGDVKKGFLVIKN